MKYRKLMQFSAAVLAVFSAVLLYGESLAAQEVIPRPRHSRYRVVDLGTLGGPNSYVSFTPIPMNSESTVAGTADTANPDPFDPNCFLDCLVVHTFQ